VISLSLFGYKEVGDSMRTLKVYMQELGLTLCLRDRAVFCIDLEEGQSHILG
jgi:hypothetical protein